MNANRLGLIVTALISDIDNTNLITRLNSLTESLSNQINEQNEEHEVQVSKSKTELREAILSSEFMRFPNTWRPTIEELGIDEYMGSNLIETVDEIFLRTTITRVDARDELVEISEQLSLYHSAFTRIVAGFDFLKIAETRLRVGEAELSILMPRDAFSNELGRFAKEVVDFDRAVKFFSELSTGSRATLELGQLSTTSPLVSISVGISICLGVLTVSEKILDVIEKTYKLREAKASAERAEAGAEILSKFDEKIEEIINGHLVSIEQSLFEQYSVDEGRKHELEIEGKGVIKYMATRLDNGYQIDGDAHEEPPLETEEGQEPDEARQHKLEEYNKVKEISKKLRYKSIPATPVLQLPTPEEDNNPNE